MKTTERLQELLDLKDREIETLQEKLEKYEDTAERDWEWATHVTLGTDSLNLPVPRLQLVCTEKSAGRWNNWEWHYLLIYPHYDPSIGVVAVPLGFTKVGGSGRSCVTDEGKITLPIRDGAHIYADAHSLNLPAYAIVGEVVEKLELSAMPSAFQDKLQNRT